MDCCGESVPSIPAYFSDTPSGSANDPAETGYLVDERARVVGDDLLLVGEDVVLQLPDRINKR